VLPEGQKMIPATLVSCIDPDLLENLVCLDEIEGRSEADEVVDTDIEAWMRKSLGEVAKLTTPTTLPPWFSERSVPTCRRKTAACASTNWCQTT
jgi:hypothetical protein